MKLCFLGGSASIHIKRWLSFFANREHDVYFISDEKVGQPIAGVTTIELKSLSRETKLRYPYRMKELRQILRDIKPDLLHAHQVSGAGWLGWLSGYHPFVVMPWGSDLYRYPKRSRLGRFLARRVMSSADMVMADSQDLLDMAVAYGADPANGYVVQWGVDLDQFKPADDKSAARTALGLPEKTIILSPRAMRPVYRHDVTVDSIRAVKEHIPDALFVFRNISADPVDFDDTLREQARDRGVEDSVLFLGTMENHAQVARVIQAADVVVSVSESDGTPVSVLEAFACGVPVIAGDIPSLREWMVNGENGFLVPVGDSVSLAEAIVQLIDDPELGASMSNSSLQLVKDRADHKRCMADVESLYRQIVDMRAVE